MLMGEENKKKIKKHLYVKIYFHNYQEQFFSHFYFNLLFQLFLVRVSLYRTSDLR